MFVLLLLQFFKAFVFTNQFKIDIWSANSRSEALLLWEVISTSKALREQAKGWPCWDPGLRLAFLTLLFCCCGSCKAFAALGLVRVGFQTSAVPDLLQLVNAYVMTSREPPLNTAACRLLLDIMPGLETAVVFQEKVSPVLKLGF